MGQTEAKYMFTNLQRERDLAVGIVLLVSARGDITMGRSRELLGMGICEQREELDRLSQGETDKQWTAKDMQRLKSEKERAMGAALLLSHYGLIPYWQIQEMLDWSPEILSEELSAAW